MKQDLTVLQGKTFIFVVRWETTPIVYKAITGVTKTAPAVLTIPSHGVPDGWSVAITAVQGMTEINSAKVPPRVNDYVKATYVDADTISLNTVNAAEYSTYTSGGYLQYNNPHELSGYTARMTVKDKVGGTELLSLTTVNARIVLDDSAKTITLTISAADTETLTWRKGVYDLELVSGSGVVTQLLYGSIVVTQEVTT